MRIVQFTAVPVALFLAGMPVEAQSFGENADLVADAAERCNAATDFGTAIEEAEQMSGRVTIMLDQMGSEGTPNLDLRLVEVSRLLLTLCVERAEQLSGL